MKFRHKALLAAAGAIGIAGGIVSPATAATYTRVMTCNSTGLPGYSATLTATWQTNSAGQADLVSTVTRYFQGVNGRDWATSATVAHRHGATVKEFATVDPAQTSTVTFGGVYWSSKGDSIVYLAASNNGTSPDTKCGPLTRSAT